MTDPFRHDDGAYVLGALSPAERTAFEAHLPTCPACSARVAEVAGLPALLDGISAAEVLDPDPVPDTLLPRLMREVAARRRRRTVLAVAAAVAAACIAAVVAVTVAGSAPTSPPVAASGRPMHALVATPVHAQVALTAQQWGTRVALHCHYAQPGGRQYAYLMAVIGRDGTRYALGGWRISGGQDITYVAGAPLPPSRIAAVVVSTPQGRPILRLRT